MLLIGRLMVVVGQVGGTSLRVAPPAVVGALGNRDDGGGAVATASVCGRVGARRCLGARHCTLGLRVCVGASINVRRGGRRVVGDPHSSEDSQVLAPPCCVLGQVPHRNSKLVSRLHHQGRAQGPPRSWRPPIRHTHTQKTQRPPTASGVHLTPTCSPGDASPTAGPPAGLLLAAVARTRRQPARWCSASAPCGA